MTPCLLARKGEAVPSGVSGSSWHALAYYAARRTVTFGQAEAEPMVVAVPAVTPAPVAATRRPRPAASLLMRPYGQVDGRRRFTFRLDEEAHARFCAAADALGCSRQKLLERALDRFLDVADVRDVRATTVAPAVPRLL